MVLKNLMFRVYCVFCWYDQEGMFVIKKKRLDSTRGEIISAGDISSQRSSNVKKRFK